MMTRQQTVWEIENIQKNEKYEQKKEKAKIKKGKKL